MAAFFPFFLLSTNLMVSFSHREVIILARVLFFSSRSYLGLCLTGMVSELLLVSKEDRDPIRILKIKGNFIMVVYQPPVLELPVPIGAYRSVNGFVCIATSVVLLVSRMEKKYLLSGNMLNQKFLCSWFFIRKSSSFPFSYEAGKFMGNRSARSDSSCSNMNLSLVGDGL